MNVSDGIVRMRLRAGGESEDLLQPGKVYPVEIVLYPTSLVFARGHRIRVDVSSSNSHASTSTPTPASRSTRAAAGRPPRTPSSMTPNHPSAVLLPVVAPR
jgi:predicted acyl esterase